MESRTEVALYAASITRELCRMCREVQLDDLAYLLEVASAEAAQVRPAVNPARSATHAPALSLQIA